MAIDLNESERRRLEQLKRGSFFNVDDLIGAMQEYINEHNRCPKPFIRPASANDILAKVKRAQARLNKL